jgi:hypothetical protein
MRIGLQRDDVDPVAGVITIREAKFDPSRLVPLHPTATEALGRDAAERDRPCPGRAREPSASAASAPPPPATA